MNCLKPALLSLACMAWSLTAAANPQASADSTPKAVAKPAVAASATTAKPAETPKAGGSGGGVGSNSSTSAQQIGPKKPKCPDPGSTACPVERTPAK